ncbi:MAG: hypothetical protein D6705_16040 [Deltaproteobacteria bacterium]|nr:MAG: hypothetical protein D6705_16040 [Deltaproteobacteria bacterium]
MTADLDLRLAPAGTGPSEALAISDHVELAWRPDALSLVHRNDHDRSHELRIVGKRVFTKLAFRPWYETPLETDAHEAWLDEALRFPHDALEAFGPALSVAAEDEHTFAIGRADPPSAEAPLVVEAAEGRFVAPEGGPIVFELDVSFRVPATSDADEMSGHLRVSSRIVPDARITIAAPDAALPYPEKTRLELDRRTLLEGLAPLAPP